MEKFRASEIEHHYGSNVHVLNDPSLTSALAQLCSPATFQPQINALVEFVYRGLLATVMNVEFPLKSMRLPTRMTSSHPESFLATNVFEPETKAVVVNLARAGTYPSHVCYDGLNRMLNPALIRQDHILASRIVDASERVTGTALAGAKIGGDVKDAIVLFPDPMGATGNTIVSILDYYQREIGGPAKKYLALHLIVTPEYLKKVTDTHSDIVVYAVRVDRGLSPAKVLASTPGQFWKDERGLNDRHYIVPGGGGFGEIMNNSFV